MTIEKLHEFFLQSTGVTTDTRSVAEGQIFFALKGPSFNGNQFARAALEAGAACCVCDEISDLRDDRIIYVDNALVTLQALARYHRNQFIIPVIGITGSNGKTTTKELMHAVLSKKYKCTTTIGNLNNHIGVPLMLLRLTAETEIAIIEMGANHLLEIKSYCDYAQPNYGLITNCGKAHLEGFGSEENIRRGKGELFDYLRVHDGTAFINSDYDYLREMSKAIPRVISYGTNEEAQFSGKGLRNQNVVGVEMTRGADFSAVTQLAGDYNLPNILAATAVGKTFSVEDEQIKLALESYAPANARSQILKLNGNSFFLDAYNANPSSMKAAIENFAALPGENKIVILGAMAELGKESPAEHNEIIRLLKKYKWEQVALAGEDFAEVPAPFRHFKTTSETVDWFRAQAFAGKQILVKGSRSMGMEKIAQA